MRLTRFCAGLLLTLTPALHADERLLTSLTLGDCELGVTAQPQWQVLDLRPQPGTQAACSTEAPASQPAVLIDLLERAFTHLHDQADTTRWRSISLGRLVQYPALSTRLILAAARDPAWNPQTGRVVNQHENALVARLLRESEFVQALDRALAWRGYRVASVSVEKVLVMPVAKVAGYTGPELVGSYPFDGQVWVQLRSCAPAPDPAGLLPFIRTDGTRHSYSGFSSYTLKLVRLRHWQGQPFEMVLRGPKREAR